MKKLFLRILSVLLVVSISSLYAYNNQWSNNEDYVVPDETNINPAQGSEAQDILGSASSGSGSENSAFDGSGTSTELNPPTLNTCPARTASPVYALSGHFTWSEVDVVLPGKSGIFLSRSYSSKDPIIGLFGNGWISNLESGFIETIRHLNDDGVSEIDYIYRKQNGLRYTFKDINGTVESPSGINFTIETISDTSFKATSSKGTVDIYVNDLLVSREDIDGNKREYVYDSDEVLESIKDSNGNILTLTFGTNGYVTAVTDQNSRVWKYAYDENGSLVSVTDPLNGQRKYTYEKYQADNDAQYYFHLTKITDETDKTVIEVTYESGRTGTKAYLNGRVKTYTHGEDTYTYNWDYLSYYGYITKTNSIGNWTRLYPSENGQVVKYTDVYYKNFLYNVDENMTLTGITDKNGNDWNQSVDDLGRVISVTSPLGAKITYTYSGNNTKPSTVTSPLGYTKQISFDSKNHPTTVTLADGSVYKISYDTKGNILDVTNPSDKKTVITTYNGNSQPLSVTNANGDTVSFTYNTFSQIATMTDAMGNKTSYSYDLLGNLTKTTNAKEYEITYLYDAAGRLVSLTDPAGNKTTYEYDEFGRLSKVIRANSRTVIYTYNSANQITKVSDSAGRDIAYTYDKLNRITRASSGSYYIAYYYDAQGRITSAYNSSSGQYVYYTYNADGQLIQEKQHSQAIDYTYDLDGNLKSLSAKGTTVTYTRNSLGKLTSISDGTNSFDFTYDTNGMRKTVTYPNALKVTSGYDDANNLITLDNAIDQLSYTYNKNGMLSKKTVNLVSTDYNYDEIARVTQAGAQTFSYSAAGNMQNNSSVYDTKTNRLTSNATYTYEYDDFGNLVKKTDKATGEYKVYTWDVWNKLTKVESFTSADASVKKIEFTYGPMGRRLTKSVDGVVEKYLYAGTNMIAIMNYYSTLKYSIMHDDLVDTPLCITDVDADKSYYYHRDYLGSIVALSDSSKNVVESYTYDAYGKTSKSSTLATGNLFAYTARELDDEDLYFYRSRYYDPTIGRFLSEDIVGFLSGDFNWYRYVGNNPINYIDPEGKAGIHIAIIAGVVLIYQLNNFYEGWKETSRRQGICDKYNILYNEALRRKKFGVAQRYDKLRREWQLYAHRAGAKAAASAPGTSYSGPLLSPTTEGVLGGIATEIITGTLTPDLDRKRNE